MVKWITILLGFLFAATIIIPTLKPGDLIAGMGVSSVAIGFAFKDILQNWLAGLLILLRQPFEIEDQIEINGFEGTGLLPSTGFIRFLQQNLRHILLLISCSSIP